MFAIADEVVVGSYFNHVDFAGPRPGAECIVRRHQPHRYSVRVVISKLGREQTLRDGIPGQIQSPRGIFARISTVPYVKLNELTVRMRAD